jgi:hypothetical protein
MKTKRAGKQYQCRGCDKPILKGQDYYSKSRSIGNPRKETVDMDNYVPGYPVVVVHGITFKHQYHADCKAA